VLGGAGADQVRTAAPVDRELLRRAITEADYLGALTANLSTAAKLDAAEPVVVWTTVDLNATIERVLARHQMLARHAGVSLDGAVPDPPVTTRADVALIEQALDDLVHNAIRYNRSGGGSDPVLPRARRRDDRGRVRCRARRRVRGTRGRSAGRGRHPNVTFRSR
jgi:signal transduction histidine kinase